MWGDTDGTWAPGDMTWAGGTPSKGTPKDKRLKQNK